MSEPIRVRCPGCGAGLKIPLSKAGRTIPCPRCNAPVSAAAPAEGDWRNVQPAPASPPAPAPAPTPPTEPAPLLWYLSRGGETSGPYTSNQLKELVLKGRLAPYDYVCQVGTTQWIEAGKLDWLFTTVTTAPEPPPPEEPEFRVAFSYKPPLKAGLMMLAFTGGALVLSVFALMVGGPNKLGPIPLGGAGPIIYLAIAGLAVAGMGFAALAVKRSFGDSRIVVTATDLEHSLYGAAGRVRWDAVSRVTIQKEGTAYLVKIYVRRGKTLWVSSGCFRSAAKFDQCVMLICGGSGRDLEPVTSAHDVMMKIEGVMKPIEKYGSPAEFFHDAITGKGWWD
ncbi:MAG: DUF4339 domain-containing protein [Gemmataceae bacterium]